MRQGQNHRLFPYPASVDRPPLAWPDGKRLAFWVAPNIEHLELIAPDGSSTARDFARLDYGNRVGIWRLMDVMDRYGIRGTVALNSDVCVHHPEIIAQGQARKWEWMGHNQTNTRRLNSVPADQERGVIHTTLTTIESATGTKPVGWLGSGLQETWNTLEHLANEGVEYVADWVNDDQPYLIETRCGRSIVSIPYTSEVNDFTVFMRQGQDVDGAFKVFKEQFDWLYRESAVSGRFMNIGLHPHVVGQAFRIRALRDFLAYAKSFDDVWFATREEIAEWYLKNHHTHIA